MMRFIITVTAVLAMAAAVPAAEVVGGGAGAFLRAPAGVRAVGLGGSYVAVADDATSLYWNPAGLGSVQAPSIHVSHTSMGLDRNHSMLGVALPVVGSGPVVGVLWDRFAVGDIQGRDVSGSPTKVFDDRENLIVGGLGYQLGALSLGGAFRFYQHGLADYTGDGTGFDLGARYELELGAAGLALAAGVSDMDGALSWDTPSGREDIIPTMTRMGAAATLPIGSTELLLAASLHSVEGEDTFASFGVEYALTEALELRTGMHDDRYAGGATIRTRNIAFSFALAEDVVENASYLTVGVDIGM